MMAEPSASDAPEDQVNKLLAKYLLALDAGEAPDHAAWLAEYPEFSQELEDFFAGTNHFERVCESLQASLAGTSKSRAAQPREASHLDATRERDRVPTSESSDTPWPVVVQSAVPGRFTPGTVLLERYHMINLIGKGGMGEVYRAYDAVLGDFVALKFLPSKANLEPGVLEPFLSEVRLARQIHHDNVCCVYDIGDFEGEPFISMEYVDGENLASLLHRVGRLPIEKALSVTEQLCAGLNAAHERGVLHRDLKPSNIMLDREGCVRIMDFGLAILETDAEQQDHIVGTPCYMAPEQWSGGDLSACTDLYALGLILYEVFSGEKVGPVEIRAGEWKPPQPPSAHVPGIHPMIESAILKCLNKDPEGRPKSASSVMHELPPKSDMVWREPRPPGEEQPAQKAARRWRLVAAVSAALLLLSAGLTTYLLPRTLPPPLTPEIARLLVGSGTANHELEGHWYTFWYEEDDTRTLQLYGLPEPVKIAAGGNLLVGWAYNTMRVKGLDEKQQVQRKQVLLETEYYWIMHANGAGRYASLYVSPRGDREQLIGSFFLTRYNEGEPGERFCYLLGNWHGHCEANNAETGEPGWVNTRGKVILVQPQDVEKIFDLPLVRDHGLQLPEDRTVLKEADRAFHVLFD